MHLGSTSYLTDTAGNVSQFVWYAPYGEALVDEHTTTYENPFKFSGKELDDITGLYDHGARNRNPITAVWYGIDELFEKYPENGPYVYCAENPVKYFDIDGEKLYIQDGKGNYIEYIYGKIDPSIAKTEFARKTIISLNYLYENGGEKTRNVIDFVSTYSSEKIEGKIVPNPQPTGNHFARELNEIQWDVTCIAKSDIDYIYSPAELLFHEIVHLFFSYKGEQDDDFFELIYSKGSNPLVWDNWQDENIIKYYETYLAKVLGKFIPSEEHPYVRSKYEAQDIHLDISDPTTSDR